MLDFARIKAITLDLDDTLWPVWPTIERAERALQTWLQTHAPATAAQAADGTARHVFRAELERDHPHMQHDMTWLRREVIRRALQQAGDDTALAEPAFEVFFAERQRVDFYADALPALDRLSRRFPLVALSNGNADVHLVGIGHHFHDKVCARQVGVGKPDPRIFQVAAERAGVAPHEVLHIGDDAALDVLGALGVGMQTVWVNRAGHDWSHPTQRPHLTVTDLRTVCDLLFPTVETHTTNRQP